MLLTGIAEGADWISKTSLSPDSLIALLWRIWQMLEQHEQLKQNAWSTSQGLALPPLKMICKHQGVGMQGRLFCMWWVEGVGGLKQVGEKITSRWWSAQWYLTSVWNWKPAVCLSWNYSEMNHSWRTGGFWDSHSRQRTDKQGLLHIHV